MSAALWFPLSPPRGIKSALSAPTRLKRQEKGGGPVEKERPDDVGWSSWPAMQPTRLANPANHSLPHSSWTPEFILKNPCQSGRAQLGQRADCAGAPGWPARACRRDGSRPSALGALGRAVGIHEGGLGEGDPSEVISEGRGWLALSLSGGDGRMDDKSWDLSLAGWCRGKNEKCFVSSGNDLT